LLNKIYAGVTRSLDLLERLRSRSGLRRARGKSSISNFALGAVVELKAFKATLERVRAGSRRTCVPMRKCGEDELATWQTAYERRKVPDNEHSQKAAPSSAVGKSSTQEGPAQNTASRRRMGSRAAPADRNCRIPHTEALADFKQKARCAWGMFACSSQGPRPPLWAGGFGGLKRLLAHELQWRARHLRRDENQLLDDWARWNTGSGTQLERSASYPLVSCSGSGSPPPAWLWECAGRRNRMESGRPGLSNGAHFRARSAGGVSACW